MNKIRFVYAAWLLSTVLCQAGSVTVQGTVRDSIGSALPGVMLRLYCGSKPYGDDWAANVYSWNGSFYLSANRSSGPVVLTAQKDGFGAWRYRWEHDDLDEFANLTIDPVLVEPCTVSGRVHNVAQEGLPGAIVKLDWLVGDGVIEYQAVSDADGIYTIPGVGTGVYTAIVLPPDPSA